MVSDLHCKHTAWQSNLVVAALWGTVQSFNSGYHCMLASRDSAALRGVCSVTASSRSLGSVPGMQWQPALLLQVAHLRLKSQNVETGQTAGRLPSTSACLQVGWTGPAPARQTADSQHRPGLQREQVPARLQGRQRCAERHLQRMAPPSGIRHLGEGSRRCRPGPSLR